MAINDIQLYNALRAKIGDNETKTLVDFVVSKIEKEFDVFLTKEDKVDIIRWMVIMILGQTALLITLIKLL